MSIYGEDGTYKMLRKKEGRRWKSFDPKNFI